MNKTYYVSEHKNGPAGPFRKVKAASLQGAKTIAQRERVSDDTILTVANKSRRVVTKRIGARWIALGW